MKILQDPISNFRLSFSNTTSLRSFSNFYVSTNWTKNSSMPCLIFFTIFLAMVTSLSRTKSTITFLKIRRVRNFLLCFIKNSNRRSRKLSESSLWPLSWKPFLNHSTSKTLKAARENTTFPWNSTFSNFWPKIIILVSKITSGINMLPMSITISWSRPFSSPRP